MKRLFQYIKTDIRHFRIWTVFMICSIVFQVLATVLTANLLNAIIAMDLHQSMQVIAAIMLTWIIALSSDYMKRRLQNKMIEHVNSEIRKDFLHAICSYDYEMFHKKGDAAFVSSFTNDINQLEVNGIKSFFSFFENITLALISFIALSLISLWLATLSILLFFIIYFVPKLFDNSLKKESLEYSCAQEIYTGKIKNLLQGYDVFYDYDAQDQLKKRMYEHSDTLENHKREFYNLQDGINIFVNFLSVCVQLINNIACIILIMLDMISPGAIMSVGNLSGKLFNALSSLSEQRVKMTSCLQLLDKNQVVLKKEKRQLPIFSDTLKLKNISFCYGDQTILDHINLVFKKHHKYAIIGDSGCGKTTLLKILSGKLTTYQGSYMMDEYPMKHMCIDNLKKQIAYIDQNAIVFDESIVDNLTLGKSYTMDEIMHAIKVSGLDDFVQTKDDLQHQVIDNGSNLSGGQRQRIMIARAILANKQIYLLDEATSNLDKQKMEKVESYLLQDSNITLIYVSHHLADHIKAQFDDIYVLS